MAVVSLYIKRQATPHAVLSTFTAWAVTWFPDQRYYYYYLFCLGELTFHYTPLTLNNGKKSASAKHLSD